MFLLIHSFIHLSFFLTSLFTFHYVSTYTRDVFSLIPSSLDLHSTMFLLILKVLRYEKPVYCIYIPLCFYLYVELNEDYFRDGVFTFHYVSTYTTVDIYGSQDYDIIYIPLCFYLYLLLAHDIIFSFLNLHSTMFLLIRQVYI